MEATERRQAATMPGRTDSGQRVGRGRAPPPLDNGANHRATMRRQLVCLASVGSRDCAPALAAKTRVGKTPGARHQLGRGASIVIARGPRPRATRQQRPLRPQAPRRRLPRPRDKRGRHRPRPLSWPLRTEWPAPLARSARHAGAMRYTMKPSKAAGAQIEDKTSGNLPWKKLPSELGERRGSVARGGGHLQTRSWSSAACISTRAVG